MATAAAVFAWVVYGLTINRFKGFDVGVCVFEREPTCIREADCWTLSPMEATFKLVEVRMMDCFKSHESCSQACTEARTLTKTTLRCIGQMKSFRLGKDETGPIFAGSALTALALWLWRWRCFGRT